MIDYQNCSSGSVNSVQKRDEQTMDLLQPRDQVVGKRAEPDEKRAADSSMVRCRSAHPDMSIVSLDDSNEEITEQWQACLHDWYACRDGQCSAKSDRVSSGVSERRWRSTVPVSNAVRYRRHVNVTPTVPQEALLSCLHSSHHLLPGSNTVSVYLTCLECRHHAKWTRQSGPTIQEFPELQRMLQAWLAKLLRRQR